MRDILLVARNHVVTAVREKITLFWFLIFPVFLLVVLSLIFGQIGQEGEISFQIALANADQASNAPFSAIIEAAFDEVAELPASGREPLFQLRKPGKGSDVNAFIEEGGVLNQGIPSTERVVILRNEVAETVVKNEIRVCQRVRGV